MGPVVCGGRCACGGAGAGRACCLDLGCADGRGASDADVDIRIHGKSSSWLVLESLPPWRRNVGYGM